MHIFLKLIASIWLVLAVVWSCLYWVDGYQDVPLDPDEVVWVLDAQAAAEYASFNWDFFTIDTEHIQLEWRDPQKRIIDQPQLGKYIIGSVLMANGLAPWESEQKPELYRQFQRVELPSGTLSELAGIVDQEVLTSISLIRTVNTYFSLLVFALCCLLVGVYLRSKHVNVGVMLFVQGVLFVSLTHNQVIRHFYRLAIVNPYSFLFHLIAVAALVYTVQKGLEAWSRKQVLLVSAVTGVCIAAATSVKLNGAFLGFSFLVLLLIFISRMKDSFKQLATILSWFFTTAIFGATTFFILEPELWLNPAFSLQQLLGFRLHQQQIFLQAFDNLSLAERVVRISQTLVNLLPAVEIGLVSLFGLTLILCCKKLKTVFSLLLKKHQFFFLLTLQIILGVIYYSQVGFARYFIPAVVVLYVWIVLALAEMLDVLLTRSAKKDTVES